LEADSVTPPLPVFGVCGSSGSGKSTLLEALVRRFTALGLKVVVIQHDVLDAESSPLEALVMQLNFEYDLIFAEGGKSANFARKVWLLREAGEQSPFEDPGIQQVLAPEEDRIGVVGAMVEEWLQERTQATPLFAGILIGGASHRMGQPKHLLRVGNTTWLEHIVTTLRPIIPQVVLLGAGEIPPGLRETPVLPDAPGIEGPMAGLLAAMRWRPDAAWLFVACDLPRISPEAVEWLLSHRAPGVRAILPRLHDAPSVEPLFALYEFRTRGLLENVRAPSEVAGLPGVITPQPPPDIAGAWANMNTPLDVK